MRNSRILSIVIPAFNEEQSIAGVLERVLGQIEQNPFIKDSRGIEVIVVDDGSKDNTAGVVARYPQVVLINHAHNVGYGAALKTGFLHAKGEHIAFLDADGTYPPEHLQKLYQSLLEQQADMVVGSRMMGEKSGMPAIRNMGNKLFARLVSWSAAGKVTDSASGMRVFRKAILPQLYPLPDGLDFIVAMSARALHEDMKIVEVPIPYEERVGESKLRILKDGVRFFRAILSLACFYNPLRLFSVTGFVLLLLAALLSIQPLWYYFQFRRVEDWEIYRLLTIMVLLVSGLQVGYFGLLSNHILSIVSNGRLRKNRAGHFESSLFGRKAFRYSILAGFSLTLVAILLNYRTIYQYGTTGKIHVHWSYVLTGSALFLAGVQLIMGGALIRILEALKERETFLRR